MPQRHSSRPSGRRGARLLSGPIRGSGSLSRSTARFLQLGSDWMGVRSRGNVDPKTVDAFGDEWAVYDQRNLDRDELAKRFSEYFSIFPFDDLPTDAEGFALGCGSGRWAAAVAPRVHKL